MSRRLISIAGFLLAAVAAPPVSAALYLLIAPMAPEGWRLVRPPAGDYAPVLIYATLAGVVPSLVFGGMTLAAMRRLIRPWPPSLAVLALGGGGAAAIYGLVSTLLRFGPWGPAQPWTEPGAALIAVCVLASGVIAGLIYAPFARPDANRG